jgi:hypothetical protein
MDTIKKEIIEPKPEDFAKAYQELCDKMKFRIVVVPQYVARDDNSFSTILSYTVGALPKETK